MTAISPNLSSLTICLLTWYLRRCKFCQTTYTLFNIPKNKRSLFTKFRFSSQNLVIETCRYKRLKIPRNDRFCPFCPSSVESEVQFLLHCNKYVNIKEPYISKHVNSIYNKHPNQNDLSTIINLLNPENLSLARDVTNFI